MVKKENEIKTLAIQEDTNKKLDDILKFLRISIAYSELASSQRNNESKNFTYISSNNSFVLELITIIAIMITVCILIFEISNSYIPLLIILILLILLLIKLIQDSRKLKDLLKITKTSSEEEIKNIDDIISRLNRDMGNV